MTSTRLAEIETRAEAASEGPWRNVDLRHQRGGQIRIFSRAGGIRANVLASADNAAADAEFIAHARDDVPALVVEVRRLRAAVDAALALADDFDHDVTIVDGEQLRSVYSGPVVANRIRRALAPVADPGPHTTSDEETT